MELSLTIFCSKCQRLITQQDISHNNYQLIILPVLIIQHLVCPPPQYQFNSSVNVPSGLTLNLNLK